MFFRQAFPWVMPCSVDFYSFHTYWIMDVSCKTFTCSYLEFWGSRMHKLARYAAIQCKIAIILLILINFLCYLSDFVMDMLIFLHIKLVYLQFWETETIAKKKVRYNNVMVLWICLSSTVLSNNPEFLVYITASTVAWNIASYYFFRSSSYQFGMVARHLAKTWLLLNIAMLNRVIAW